MCINKSIKHKCKYMTFTKSTTCIKQLRKKKERKDQPLVTVK